MSSGELQIQDQHQKNSFSYSQQTAKFIIERIIYNLWGFKPVVMQELVRRNGGLGGLLFVGKNMTRFEYLMSKWGPIKVHLLCGNVSILNGCPYCVFGHSYALNLHYFNDFGELFLLDEHEYTGLAKLPFEEKLAKIRAIYEDQNLKKYSKDLEIQLALINGKTPSNREEKNIQFINQLYNYLNACAIEGNAAPDEAHDKINKNKALKEKYQLARMF